VGWSPAQIHRHRVFGVGKFGVSRPPHPIDLEGADCYVDRLITDLPLRLRKLVDNEKLRLLAQRSGERDRFYSRHILSRVDELSRWMNSNNVR
jgi:hypothetical protein